LAAYVRRGEIFTRPSPNTFGLLELGHDNEADASPKTNLQLVLERMNRL
jgi:hypothetical protein